eukprot:2159912-Prymnesium_polylepis.1
MTDFDADFSMLTDDPAAFAPFAPGPPLNMGDEPLNMGDEPLNMGEDPYLEHLVEQLHDVDNQQLAMASEFAGHPATFGDDELLSAAVEQPIQLPLQIRLDGTGNVGVCKNVAFCHQPPFKDGCAAGIGEFRGGADKDKRRYCYEC